MDILFELHHDLPREGPGDSLSTARALAKLNDLPTNPTILDIGCGPGMQTIDIATLTGGRVLAVDNHHPFLSGLQERVRQKGLEDHISFTAASMFNLPFPERSFDCIWSEGAIYIMGLYEGLKSWRSLLKSGGYLAVTELSWLRLDPPPEITAYWLAEYPGISTVPENLNMIHMAEYRVLDHFTLPNSSWWTSYYTPLEGRISWLREKYQQDTDKLEFLDAAQKEIDFYRKYSEWYGYVFYLMQMI